MKSGIYQILNLVTGKRYIGSSGNLVQRFWKHKCTLKQGYHHCFYLQKSYNKHGKENFKIEVIEYTEVEKLIEREQFWIDKYEFTTLYNSRPIADSNRGVKHTEEFKEKRRNLRHSEDAKKRIKESATGRIQPPRSQEWRDKMSKSKKGVSNINSGNIKKGEKFSPETEFKKGIVPWNKGTHGVSKAWNKGTKGVCKPNSASFKKGESVSPRTQFKKGQKAWNKGIPSNICPTKWNKGVKGFKNGGSFKPKFFSLVSPTNILYEGFGIRPFTEEMGLTTGILVVINKKKEFYKGWRLPKKEDVYDGIGLWLDAA